MQCYIPFSSLWMSVWKCLKLSCASDSSEHLFDQKWIITKRAAQHGLWRKHKTFLFSLLSYEVFPLECEYFIIIFSLKDPMSYCLSNIKLLPVLVHLFLKKYVFVNICGNINKKPKVKKNTKQKQKHPSMLNFLQLSETI